MRLLLTCCLLCVVCSAPALGWSMTEPYGPGRIHPLSRTSEISTAVSRLSGGNSALLLDEPASASPSVGYVARRTDWGGWPFITVYQASSSFIANLDGIGPCVVLGAVALLVDARAPSGESESQRTRKAPAGVYMLAYTGSLSDQEKETGSAVLIQVTRTGKYDWEFRDVLSTQAIRYSRPANVVSSNEDWHGVRASFPNKDQVSDSNPAWRAKLLMATPEPDRRYRNYEFALDQEITML